MSSARFTVTFAASLLASGLLVAACGGNNAASGIGSGASGSGASGSGSGAGSGTGGSGSIPSQICLLHNCNADVDCAACSGGHTTCLTSQHRCVACDAGGATGCPTGQVCSSSGNCIPPTLTCPTSSGTPTITCNADADCGACDPAHQVCDPTAHKCVACTASDVSQCQSTETCVGGACSPKCPASCASDGDCSDCGSTAAPAHACNAHQCAPCSPTLSCSGGMTCSAHGTCTTECGAASEPTGICTQDSDCTGCTGASTTCNDLPIGGGTGKCGPAAAGCSDLGSGVAVLPAPFNEVTNLCSTDMDCASVGVNLNVGAILRDITGFSEIHDATLMYPEHVCASVSLAGKSCGVCVPCKVDSDCESIPVDQIAGQAFGPLGTIATDFLLDQIFGPNDHEVHMFCQTVADGYGVCAPCPGIVNDCSVGSTPTGTGTCTQSHTTCAVGDPLDPSCGACEVSVCTVDPYCCTTQWDQTCVTEVGDYCADDVCCAHAKCSTGGALDATCSTCAAAVCQVQPSCCSSAWDQSCIDLVPQYCKSSQLCQGQCNDASQCSPQGCLATYMCGPCTEDYDCGEGNTCDTSSGDCQ